MVNPYSTLLVPGLSVVHTIVADESVVDTVACPIGDLSETVVIKAVLDQIMTTKVLDSLKARMRQEEFDIVVSNLLREVPALEDIVRKR